MLYVNSALTGILTGIAAVVGWLLIKTALSTSIGEGVGAISFGFSDLEIMLVAIAGFAAGFTWRLRRARRIQSRTS